MENEDIMSKVAFLFLTKGNHNCEIAWNLFLQDINPNLYSIYCHPKTAPSQPFLKDNIIKTTINTRWGDISLVNATLLLLAAAYQDKRNIFFVLVSDSCVPVVNFGDFYRFLLQDNKSYIYWRHIPNREDRYRNLSLKLRQKISFNHFYSQHQWMILIRKHVKIALAYNLLNDFKQVHACDEHYFVTLFNLVGLLKTEFINKKTTYCDWSNKTSMHPRIFNNITSSLIEMAHKNQTFFLRKVSKSCNISNYLIFILNLK